LTLTTSALVYANGLRALKRLICSNIGHRVAGQD
jgi:hypothetical protein